MALVLVVDDDPDIVDLAELYLEGEGFDVIRAGGGLEALALAAEARPDLIVLDLMLPEIDGWELCRRWRAEGGVPIIMLTARGDPVDRVVGLELGADDYLVKPFYGRELVARVNAVLRRAEAAGAAGAEGDLRVGDIRIDPARRVVLVAGLPVTLRAREFELLHYLMRNQGLALTRNQLLDNVWGYDFLGDSRTVDVHIAHVRSRIEGSTKVAIETVWGVGYKLSARP
jgi:DNA-binding response OmpR family regulator